LLYKFVKKKKEGGAAGRTKAKRSRVLNCYNSDNYTYAISMNE